MVAKPVVMQCQRDMNTDGALAHHDYLRLMVVNLWGHRLLESHY
mgnify:CR=1 FL=1